MPATSPSRFSILLTEMREGREEARSELIQFVYQDLRRIAQNYLNQDRPGQTLQATALVHEVYLRLFGEHEIDWQNKSHFLIIAARQMRRILVDHARAAQTAKRYRGRGQASIEEAAMLPINQTTDLVALNDALSGLEKLYPRAGEVIHLRFFVGLTEEDTARVLGISPTTVKREWAFARAWLYEQMGGRAQTEQ